MRGNIPKFWKTQTANHYNLLENDIYYKNLAYSFMAHFGLKFIQQLPRFWKDKFSLNYNIDDPNLFSILLNSGFPSFNIQFKLGDD